MRRPNVVLVILDAFPHDVVTPELTPTLFALAQKGGRARHGGRSVLSASTYPNHATLVTGVGPDQHGVFTTKALVDGQLVPAQDVGPAAATLFDLCLAGGRRAVAAFGDQNLVGVCGARRADAHWPPQGVLPEGAPLGAFGYGADRAVVDALDGLEPAAAELCVVQLDEVDTARHRFGPAAVEALDQVRATDAALGEVLERFAARWHETVVLVVSDHDCEEARPGAIDLAAETRSRGLDVTVDHDGTAALIVGEIGECELLSLPGVVGHARISSACQLVWGEAGQQFGIDWGLKGHHGSPRTAKQLAVVGGGHAAVASVARRIEQTSPPATFWAQLVRELLELG